MAELKKRLILIEDEAPLREYFTEMFQNEGYEVEAHNSVGFVMHNCGFSGLDMLDPKHGNPKAFPDVVVTDNSTISAETGCDLLRAFKGKGVGLVLMSSNYFGNEDVKKMGGDIAEYVQKSQPGWTEKLSKATKRSLESAQLEKLGFKQKEDGRSQG